MFDLNLPNSDLTPHLRRARSERAETTAGILRAGIVAIGKGIAALAAAHARRRLRRQTVRELRALPDRTLRDIGIPHSEIWAVANDLVNGSARYQAPAPAPRHGIAANQNRPESRPHAAVPAAVGCG